MSERWPDTPYAHQLRAERDALRDAIEGWLKAYRRFDQSPREYDAEQKLRAVLGGEAAPPSEGQDLGASEARSSEGKT